MPLVDKNKRKMERIVHTPVVSNVLILSVLRKNPIVLSRDHSVLMFLEAATDDYNFTKS